MDKEAGAATAKWSPAETERRLAFSRQLQTLANSIHAAADMDGIKLGLSRELCHLFGCDRLTIYTISERKTEIESKMRLDADTIKHFRLPISDTSIVGYVALTRRAVNISDVYDDAELHAIAPNLQFLQKIDQKLHYRTREMLAVPVLHPQNGELLGALQLVNNRLGGPFAQMIEDGAKELSQTLAIAIERHSQTPAVIRTKFDPLAVLGLLSKPELELARRSARRKEIDQEDVLIDEFQVTLAALGAAYAHYFDVAYEPFRAERKRSTLLQNFRRDYIDRNAWLVLEDSPGAVVLLALDPENLRNARTAEALFPKTDITYRVTTRREFVQTVDQLFAQEVAQEIAQNAPQLSAKET
ncbi:MAG: GAF domain-containing protein, partial [Proteobacteria bacterium]|nr:GAF domain-containing protein [Pseudomonadota bacterium]